MIERRYRLGLALEAGAEIPLGPWFSQILAEHLHRNLALQTQICGEVNPRKAAPPEHIVEPVSPIKHIW